MLPPGKTLTLVSRLLQVGPDMSACFIDQEDPVVQQPNQQDHEELQDLAPCLSRAHGWVTILRSLRRHALQARSSALRASP